jgi:hypothetical protein
MTPEQWRQIERLFDEAMSLDESERTRFLKDACGADASLYEHIRSLLSYARSEHLPSVLERAGVGTGAPVLPSDWGFLFDGPNAAVAHPEARSSPRGRSLPVWAQVAAAGAFLQTAASLAIYLSAQHPALVKLPVPAWVYASLATVFAVCGLGLVLGHRNDVRAAWLGGVFAMFAAPLAMKLHDGVDALRWMAFVRPQVFVAPFLWHFLVRFPSGLTGTPRRWIRAAAIVSTAVALFCLVPHVQTLWLHSRWPPPTWAMPLLKNKPEYVNWLLVQLASVPALPLLVWRVRVARGEERHRLDLFVRGLLVGVVPFTLEVLVEELWPPYKQFAHQPTTEPWIGTAIFGALAIVPFVTAYSVLFDRVLELRIVLRMALQYALARYTVIAATLIPFAALVAFVFEHRTEPLVNLMTGVRPVMLSGAGALGLAAFRLGSRWLDAVDRQYFREPYDARAVLIRFLSELRADTVEELALSVDDELERALHAGADMFLRDQARHSFVHVYGRLPALSTSSTLARLAQSDASPMRVDAVSDLTLRRLPATERQWIQEGGFDLVIPLRDAEGGLTGLLALTAKRSGLPYSDEDRRLLAAVGSAVSLVAERVQRRGMAEPVIEPAARECTRCMIVSAPDAQRCVCGGELAVANVPYRLRGVFQLEERVGRGGMGVVYRAVDVNLRRAVAIKALPRVNRQEIARLRHEARSMAAISHPNLAVIHGIEMWNGLPFLVEEYLAGGTLAARLKSGPLPLAEVLDLGVTLADLLHHLHGTGIVHCDIKPGNIGFTQQGVVKLLDFGLARVFSDAHATETASTDSAAQAFPEGWFGTPAYMSPEAARGEPATPLFDLWALSVVLYQTLCGRLPYEGSDAVSILGRIARREPADLWRFEADVRRDVVEFFENALARDPLRRPSSAVALAAALRRLRGVPQLS